MRTTIDSAGRIVVPKRLRDALGFGPGQELDVSVRDGRLEVEVPATEMRLEESEGGVVAVADREMPSLSAERVRDTLENIRR